MFGQADTNGYTFTTYNNLTPIFWDGSQIPPHDGARYMPKKLEVIDNFSTETGRLIFGLGLTSLLLALLPLTLLRRLNTQILIFGILIIVAALIASASIFSYFGKPSSLTCMMQLFGPAISFSLTLGVLLSNNIQILIVVKAKRRLKRRFAMMSKLLWMFVTLGPTLIELVKFSCYERSLET